MCRYHRTIGPFEQGWHYFQVPSKFRAHILEKQCLQVELVWKTLGRYLAHEQASYVQRTEGGVDSFRVWFFVRERPVQTVLGSPLADEVLLCMLHCR